MSTDEYRRGYAKAIQDAKRTLSIEHGDYVGFGDMHEAARAIMRAIGKVAELEPQPATAGDSITTLERYRAALARIAQGCEGDDRLGRMEMSQIALGALRASSKGGGNG